MPAYFKRATPGLVAGEHRHGSIRLPELAATIRRSHDGVKAAAQVAAEHPIAAGTALIEAKKMLGHGEWLPWLKEHCHLSEHTAQLYMKIVRLGLKSETVANLGVKAAGKVIAELSYDPFAGQDDAQIRDRHILALYLVEKASFHPDSALDHVCWLRRQEFESLAESLGLDNTRYRAKIGFCEPSDEFKGDWPLFHATWDGKVGADIARQFAEAAEIARPRPSRAARRRKRQAAGSLG